MSDSLCSLLAFLLATQKDAVRLQQQQVLKPCKGNLDLSEALTSVDC